MTTLTVSAAPDNYINTATGTADVGVPITPGTAAMS